MLDLVTLRIAFGLVALSVLVLVYGVTFRTTRSAYSGWWCVSIGCFILSATLFLFDGTALQVVGNPAGNTMGVLGAGCVWASARSLRAVPVPRWQLAAVPAVVAVASALGDPSVDSWSGGAAFLTGMALLIGRSTLELVLLLRQADVGVDSPAQNRFALVAMAVVSSLLGAYYLARATAFVTIGPQHPVFQNAFGGQVTTLLTMILLVVATFGMSALAADQQIAELRRRATRDSLTGLLNRAEFYREGQVILDRGRFGTDAALVLADLDQFKDINDDAGHAAGDDALTAFADACREVIGPRGIVGRLGGDEFVILTVHGTAEDLTATIAHRYAEADGTPTVSFGIASVLPGDDVALGLARADHALYRAKAAGRAQAVRHDDRPAFLVGGRRTA
ncbi:GGDEF domain-containing protein [Pimelobacter simplex]|uniref:GGDEF domain-containing protein n=1 Tax=Nocardioides simplex TaxID=2045 RepID=UPI003AB00E21